MRLEGEYSTNIYLEHPEFSCILSPSTIAGAFVHAMFTYGGKEFEKFTTSVAGAYLVFDRDTRIIPSPAVVSLYDGKNRNKNGSEILITKVENLYAVVIFDNDRIRTADLKNVAESIPTFGWNDVLLQVEEAFVENPKKASVDFVNSYVRQIDADMQKIIRESFPVLKFKLQGRCFSI